MNNVALNMAPSSLEGVSDYTYIELLGRVKKALDSATEVSVLATDIRPCPDQPRKYFNDSAIRRLSESIDAGGQTTSGMIRKKVRDTQYELIDGERRWRSILLIPENRRPLYKAKLLTADDEVVRYLISGIANFNREGHTAIEVMETIDQMTSFKFPMEEIASLLGISVVWAYQMHGLKQLTPEVRKLLDPDLPKEQRLPVTAAVQISKIEGRYQLGLAEQVVSKTITLQHLRGEVIRVAQKEGDSKLRIRDVSPEHKWGSFGKKLKVITRNAGDAQALIEKDEIKRFVKTRPREANDLLREIENARKSLVAIENTIRGIR